MSFVYWVYEDKPGNFPYNSGYVGVSENPKARWSHLRRTNVAPMTTKLLPLFEGERESCLILEQLLRPHKNVGWNIQRGGATSAILTTVKSLLAKVESQKISERTRAGMERAKVQGTESGKPIGRPRISPALQQKITKQLGEGLSAYAIAKKLGIDAHTVARYRDPFETGAATVE